MESTDPTTQVCAALADPHRRAILGWLAEGPKPVSDLVARLPMTQPGVTRHLGVLERAGLIRRLPQGRQRLCMLAEGGLAPLEDWITAHRRFWERALDRIAEMAEESPDDRDRHDPDADRSGTDPRDRGDT